jgi:RNA polymerase sigma-70 factor (ECF subfamily)
VTPMAPATASLADETAFSAVFEQYSDSLTHFVTRIVRSPHVAAELVQDLFLRVWSGRAELTIRGDLPGYLRRAARNRALDWLRRDGLQREWERTAAYEMSAWGPEPALDADQFARMSRVMAATLAAMPERRRAVCELRWREGLGPAAIAQRLGVSLKTVETHITRGLKDLRAGACVH